MRIAIGARACRGLHCPDLRPDSRAGKGGCRLDWADVAAYATGLIAVLVPDLADDTCALRLRRLRDLFGDRAYLALTLRRRPNDQLRLWELSQLAQRFGVPTVVTNDVLYHDPSRRILQDVVTAIRHNLTIDALGLRRERHADRYLKPPEEMARLFSRHPEALARSGEIADRCRFSLDELCYQYPEERDDPALSPQETLERLTWDGATARYPEGVPPEVTASLTHELALIEKLEYAPYFLTVHSIVRFARSQNILCQGRGSAANSAVCYVLGITAIDPGRNDLLFERFVSEERREPPDIDVDFEHERREEVIQWIYRTYGRDRAALTATVIRYRAKGALRDVGKAMGLPEDLIQAISGQIWAWSEEGVSEAQIRELNLDPSDRRLRLTLELARQLMGFPRHLSQHPGGFVLTQDRLDDLVPIEPAAMEDRQIIEWDKDDIDALRFMKVDVLALGMLTCMAKGLALIARHKGIAYDLASIPAEDPRTYAMIRKADTLGTFQIESRAQMAMLPRLKPRTYYDLVVQVAIVRPGPIQGDMVHPYLRRRNKEEEVDYPSEELKPVFERTLGVPLFQEQVMELAIVAAEYTPDEADKLRRAMAAWKRHGSLEPHRVRLTERMLAKGYQPDFIARIFEQIKGFGSYGFPESHAASFALLTYASCWLKRHEPAAFACALINSWPMGFYNPDQILQDARRHQLEIRPVDVRHSGWDCSLEPSRQAQPAIRLGLRMVRGFREADAQRIEAARQRQPFTDIHDLCLRAELEPRAREQLADAGALRGLAGHRHRARWAVAGIEPQLPLFASLPAPEETSINLPLPSVGEDLFNDYATLGTTLGPHPLLLLRDELKARRCRSSRELGTIEHGRPVSVAGLVIGRQRPQTASGVIFVTLEDEFGMVNVVVWRDLAERQRRPLLQSQLLRVDGHLESASGVRHLIAGRLSDLTPLLTGLDVRSRDFQ